MGCWTQWGWATAAIVASLHQLAPATAQDRMQLGTPAGAAIEFQTEVGDRVFFGEGSAELGARARTALAAQAAWLKRHAHLPVIIEGHADDSGAAGHNLDVSLRRAEAVRRRLVETGIAPERIRVLAYGRERLVAECPASACAQQNRRVVTIVGAPSAAAAPVGESAAPPPHDTAGRRSARRLY